MKKMSKKSRYENYLKNLPEVELKNFRLISSRDQIKESDFICIMQTDLIDDKSPYLSMKDSNIFRYNDKIYNVNIIHGMYGNFVKESKQLREDLEMFKDHEFTIWHVRGDKSHLEFFTYMKWDNMIKECSVFTYPSKVRIKIKDQDIITHLDIKEHFELRETVI